LGLLNQPAEPGVVVLLIGGGLVPRLFERGQCPQITEPEGVEGLAPGNARTPFQIGAHRIYELLPGAEARRSEARVARCDIYIISVIGNYACTDIGTES